MDNPEREGHTFVGWDRTVPDTVPAENLTITALFEINRYTLILVFDNGKDDIDITGDYGMGITAPGNPIREGHTFVGWDTAVPDTMPAENLTITALWKVNQYTITVILGNGEDDIVITDDYGTEITVPDDPIREGHTFTGWDTDIPETMPAEDITARVIWELNTYIVSWNIDGTVFETNVEYRAEITIPRIIQKKNYEFLGWDIEIPETMPAHDIQISAVFSIDIYSITWVIDDTQTVVEYECGSDIAHVNDPSKEGFTFTGWDCAIPDTMPDKDLIAKATWSVNSYSVFWIVGESVIENVFEYRSEVAEPETPARDGHTFIGWSHEIPETMPAENIVISADWSVNTYSVFWDIDGVQVENRYEFGSPIGIIDNPAKEGYTFTGWDRTPPLLMPSGNITMTATWMIDSYAITWVIDDLEIVNTYEYGTEVSRITDPVKEGHSFRGWNTAIPDTMPASDLKTTALWSVNTYTVIWIVDENSTVQTYDFGDGINQVDYPIKNGCSFSCWNAEVPETMPSEDLVFVAVWDMHAYTLTFDLGDSIIEISSEYGFEVNFDGIPERQGYEFAGWDRELPITMPAENITVSAEWTPKTYTIHWKVDGEVMESTGVSHGEIPAEPTDIPVRESDARRHYEFDRWSPEPVAADRDAEYNALFTETFRTYTVTFDTNGGTGNPPSPVSMAYGTILQLAPANGLSKNGHVLKGWSTASSGDVINELEVNSDICLYAVWDVSEDDVMSLILPATAATLTTALVFGAALWRRRMSGKTE